ncbi:MAG: EscU/YscU/HrcU family type III secretion system export apparatus switch protein [Pseudomonadota bacterium]
MAEEKGQEKTEDATPKRLRDARKKGQVAKSRDLNTIIVLIGGFIILAFMRGNMGEELRAIFETNFELVGRGDLTTEMLFRAGQQTFFSYLHIVLPFFAGIVFIAFAVGFFQIGPIFSAEPMKPQLKRLNAIENLKNMFKITTLVELLKNIAKLTLIFWLAYSVVFNNLRQILLTVTASPEKSMLIASQLIVIFLIKVFVVFIVIAIIDVMVQRWHYKKQMRMTKDEVKREYKQDEGDPLIKSARKQMHREFAMSDTRQQVASSDVVVTNPTEVAVAIKYDDKEMLAPEIMAKGQRLFAQSIREIAEEFSVPIISNPPLAWTLIELDIGDEIPEELYAAIAEILVQVYRLKEQAEK